MSKQRSMVRHVCGHLQSHWHEAGEAHLLERFVCNACWSRSLDGRPPLAGAHHGRMVVLNFGGLAARLREAGYRREYDYIPERDGAGTVVYRGGPAYVRTVADDAAERETLREMGCEIVG